MAQENDHKRSLSTAEDGLPAEPAPAPKQEPSLGKLKKEEKGLAPECVVLRRMLEKTRKSNTMLFDWKQTGCSTFAEYSVLSDYVEENKKDDPLINHEAGTFLLSSPLLHIDHVGHLTHTDLEETSQETQQKKLLKNNVGKSVGTITRCAETIGPVCFRRTGDWHTKDLIGGLVSDVDGLPKCLEDHPEYLQWFRKKTKFTREEEFELTPGTTENDINLDFMECLKDVTRLLKVSGHHLKVKQNLTASNVHLGNVADRTSKVNVDLFIVAETDGDYFPILPVEVKKPLMDHLVRCLDWHYYYERGGRLHFPKSKPSKGEITQCVTIMTQIFQYSLAYGIEEVLLWDGVTATAIKFNVTKQKDIWREKRVKRWGKRNSNVETVAVVDFVSKTTSFNDNKLPVAYMVAAMAWRQIKRLGDEEAYTTRRAAIKATSEKIYLKPKSVAGAGNKEISGEPAARTTHKGRRKGKKRQKNVDSECGPHPVGDHVPKLEYEPIQTGDHVFKVIGLNKQQQMQLFPNVKTSKDGVVVKIADVGSLETYYERHQEYELFDTEYEELLYSLHKELWTEIECYRRIAQYNRVSEKKINAPEMLEYGYCCFEDDVGEFIMGMFIVLEDLGVCVPPPEDDEAAKKLIDEQLELLKSIGIVHGDVAARNLSMKDGKMYIFDFGRAELSESQNIFV